MKTRVTKLLGIQYPIIQDGMVVGTRGRAALQSGEVDNGVISTGQGIGLIDDIPTCADLIERMVAECRQRLHIASRWAEGSSHVHG